MSTPADTTNTVLSVTVERPNNREAEQAVLAAMILDSDVVEEALARLTVNDFYRGAHRAVFSAINDLSERRTPIDQITLADRLEARGELEQAGGRNYLVQLASNSLAIYNWENHVEIVRRNSLMRDLLDASEQIRGLALSPIDDADQIVGEAERYLFEITEQRVDSNFESLNSLLLSTTKALDEQADKHLVGVPTGFIDLDEHLAGFRSGDLVILAARPGVGKSALALNIAINAAKAGITVAYFSLEMPGDQLTQRILCSEAGIDGYRMRTANLNDNDWSAIFRVSDMLSPYAMYIDDNPSLNLMQLRAKARRQMRNVAPGEGLVVIDYLQLMQPTNAGYERQRYVEVGELTRGLKILAKELQIPVMALSQLSRSIESRTDKRPLLSDLRESGSIEQDADVVLFIDRSMYKDEAEKEDRPPAGTAKLYIGKNRNGLTGNIDLAYNERTIRFDNLTRFTIDNAIG